MARQEVVFEFPDPEGGDDGKIVVAGRVSEAEAKAMNKAAPEEPEGIDIEVVDDTPPKDRNRKASEPPAEVTEEELSEYSDKVKNRIKHFSKGYHDERRAKESALRERQELENLAQQLVSENNKLKGNLNKNQEVLLEQAKKEIASELENVKRTYKQAYEAGDSDAIVDAQEALTNVKLKADKVHNFAFTPLQEDENPVQQHISTQATSAADQKAVSWQQDNTWFGADDEMTSFALGLHSKLVKQGVDPRSDEYYGQINARMRQVFPDQFESDDEYTPDVSEKPKRKANVVAPATRSTAPKKIVLSQTQVNIAKRLGVPLELYAQQVANEMRK
jgi:hypothetical protein